MKNEKQLNIWIALWGSVVMLMAIALGLGVSS